MKHIKNILLFFGLIFCIEGNSQIILSEIQDTVGKGYVPITDYDPELATYIQKYMLLQDYLRDSIDWNIGTLDLYQVLTNGNDAGGLDALNFAEVEADEFIGDLRGAVLFKAQAGETLAKGDVVYVSGISGNTTIVSKADADDANKMPAFGVVAAAASLNNPVDIYTFGTLSNLNTSAYTLGDVLYVSTTAGQLTATPPTGESALLQNIAKVTRVDNSAGSIKISGAGRTNATPNLNTGRLFVGNASNQAVADGTIYVDIANGRVGIGTSSPNQKLHIVDGNANFEFRSISNGAELKLHGADDTNQAIIFGDATDKAEAGIYYIAADKRLSINGYNNSNAITIDNALNVGIGLTNPSAKLDINGDVEIATVSTDNTTDDVLVHSSDGTVSKRTLTSIGDEIDLNLGDDNLTIPSGIRTLDVSSATRFNISGSSSKFTVENTGEVGIGFEFPQVPLHVAAVTNGFQDAVKIQQFGTSGVAELALLHTQGQTDFSDFIIGMGQTGAAYIQNNKTDTNAGLNLTTVSTTGDIKLRTQSTDRLVVDQDGNVSIGHSSPAVTVDIRSGSFNSVPTLTVRDTDDDHARIRLRGTDAATLWDIRNEMNYSWDDRGTEVVTHYDDVDTYIWRNNAGTEQMRLNSTGLGIGISPSGKLDVYGGYSRFRPLTDGSWVIDLRNAGNQQIGKFISNSSGNGAFSIYTGAGSENVVLNSSGNSYFNGGNVGIGVTPSAKLDVVGEFQLDNATNGANRVLIDSDGSGNTEFVDLSTLSGGTDDQTLQEVMAQGNSSSINLNLTASTTESQRIEVGLGRTGNGYAFIDLIGDATYSDYGLRIIRNNNGANASSVITHRGSDALILRTEDANSSIKFQPNGTSSKGIVTSNGDWGFGMTTPNRTVEITNTGSAYEAALEINSNSDAANWARLDLTNVNAPTGGFIFYQDNGGKAGIRNLSTDRITYVVDNSSSFHAWEIGAGTEQMRLNSTGLGIGTTNPQDELHISNTTEAALRLEDGGKYGRLRYVDNNIGVSWFEIDIDPTNSSVASTQIFTKIDGTTQTTLNSTGLGIGVTPSAKLDVNGNVEIATVPTENTDNILTYGSTGLVSQRTLADITAEIVADPSLDLEQVLTNGNDAGGQAANNFSTISIGTTTETGYSLYLRETNPNIGFYDTDITSHANNISGNSGHLAYSVDPTSSGSYLHLWYGDGSEIMRLTDTGDLGIGTTSPNAKLHVESDAIGTALNDGGIVARLHGEAGNNLNLDYSIKRIAAGSNWFNTEQKLSFNVDGNSSKDVWIKSINATSTSDNILAFGEGASTEWMRIDNGNVGIGLSNPLERFVVSGGNMQLRGSTYTDFTDFWIGSGGDNSAFFTPYGFLGSSGSFAVSLYSNGYRNDSAGFTYIGTNGNTSTASGIDLMPTGDIYFRNGTASGTSLPIRMTIKNGGDTGIGTSSPSAKLDVSHPGDGNNILRIGAERAWIFQQRTGTSGATTQLNLKSETGGAKRFNITDYLENIIWGVGASTTSDGYFLGNNWGIGTSSPTQKLHVIGNIAIDDLNSGGTFYGIDWDNSAGYHIKPTQGLWAAPDYQQLEIEFETGIILNGGNGTYGKSYVDVQESDFIVTDGSVGIGTSSPAKQVEIENTGANATMLIQTTDDYNAYIEYQNNSGGGGLNYRTGVTTSEHWDISSSAQTMFRIDRATLQNTSFVDFNVTDGSTSMQLNEDGLLTSDGTLKFVNSSGGYTTTYSTVATAANFSGQTTIGGYDYFMLSGGTLEAAKDQDYFELKYQDHDGATHSFFTWDAEWRFYEDGYFHTDAGIVHLNDEDTFFKFTDNKIQTYAGNSLYPKATYNASGVTFNENRILSNDFRVNGTVNYMIFGDASENKLGIFNGSPNAELDVGGRIEATSHIISGVGSGGVAMTINDGKGNANLTFNHTAGVPEQAGAAARIEVNTDATTNAYMHFELKENNATSSINLVNALTLFQDNANSTTSAYAAVNDATPNHPFTVTWNGSQYFRVETDGDLSLAHNGGGTVSIGHISPDATKVLDVEGDSEFNGDVEWEDGALSRMHGSAVNTADDANPQVKIDFNSSVIQQGNATNSTVNDEITITQAGWYQVSIHATMYSGTTGSTRGIISMTEDGTVPGVSLVDDLMYSTNHTRRQSRSASFIYYFDCDGGNDVIALQLDRAIGASGTSAKAEDVSLEIERLIGY